MKKKEKANAPRQIWHGSLGTQSVRMIYLPDKNQFVLERDTGLDSLGAHQWVRWEVKHYPQSYIFQGMSNFPQALTDCPDFGLLLNLFGNHILGKTQQESKK